jgi:long-chain acyl-CoA synthetase
VNVAHALERSRERGPERAAIVCEGRTLSYAELDSAASRAANALRELGVERGDRVALFLPNIPAFAISYLGIQKLGAIAVSLNSLLKRDEVRFILEDSQPRVVVTTAAQRANVPDDELATKPVVVIAEGEATEKDRLLEALLERASDHAPAIDVDASHPAAILYTSGTTGFPKGATLSHGNVTSNIAATERYTGMTSRDRLLLFLPLFHCFGQNFILMTGLRAGATLEMQRRFVMEQALESIQRREGAATMLFGVPTTFITLLNAGLADDTFRSTRYCFSAAAPLPMEIARAWEEKFGHKIWEGYGLTETSPFASYNHERKHKLGSIGEAIEGVEMKVVGPDGAEVERGVWGEIVIKGPNVMLGYWNRPQDTASAIRDGWFHSGDIGVRDEDGYFSICDRLKDMIITSGFNVYPAEVENVLYAHPAVGEAAVYGAPDTVRGEQVNANVVLRPGAVANAEELIEFCRSRIAGYKTPRHIEIVAQIPKSPTGKILKRVLRGETG